HDAPGDRPAAGGTTAAEDGQGRLRTGRRTGTGGGLPAADPRGPGGPRGETGGPGGQDQRAGERDREAGIGSHQSGRRTGPQGRASARDQTQRASSAGIGQEGGGLGWRHLGGSPQGKGRRRVVTASAGAPLRPEGTAPRPRRPGGPR